MVINPHTRRVGLCAVAAALYLVLSSTALASFPGQNGRISFARYDADGFEQLWTANPDLTAAEQITAAAGNSVSSAWAPDSSRIAFDSDRSGTGVDVFTMKPDGSDLEQLTAVGFNGSPSYSPDGTHIALESDLGQFPEAEGIYTMRPDGRDLHLVLPASQLAVLFTQSPKFSPDGQTIAFTAVRHPRDGKRGRAGDLAGATGAVFLVDTDGRDARRVTAWGHSTAIDVEWSPDGEWLAFETEFHRGNGPDLYLVHPDGSGLRNLTNNATVTPKRFDGSSDPAWAPDGSRILFIEAAIVSDVFGLSLWSIRPDGTDRKLVEHTDLWEDQPAWGGAALR
jgi:Tol biopolymer transport system component